MLSNEIQASSTHYHSISSKLNLTQPSPPTNCSTKFPNEKPPLISPSNLKMGKKMKLPFLYNSKNLDPKLSSSSSSSSSYSSSPPWPWPSCGNINTLSFRASSNTKDDTFRTFNSAFLDTQITPPDSFFTICSSSRSFSTLSEEDSNDPVENAIRGLRSDRLFFDPELSSSLVSTPLEEDGSYAKEDIDMKLNKSEILSMESNNPYEGFRRSIEAKEEKDENYAKEDDDMGYKKSEILSMESNNPYEDFRRSIEAKEEKDENYAKDDNDMELNKSEILSMESNNPYEDFRRSMEEMIEAHGLKDWGGLEELLGCYLKVNGKNNHGFIVGAFFDLLVSLSFDSSIITSTSTSSISLLSSSTSLSTQSNYSSPSSPLSLPSSSLTSILDHDGNDDNDNDNDNDDDDRHDDDDHVILINN